MKKLISMTIQTLVPSFVRNTYLSVVNGCLIHPTAKIYYPRNISFGKGCRIGQGTIIVAQKKDSIKIGKGVVIDEYCIINSKQGEIEIKSGTHINQYCMIQASGEVEIGEKCAIAPYTRIVPNHKFTYEDGVQPIIKADTEIGDNVWIGAGVTIIHGSSIGERSIVGANAVVMGNIESGKLAVGAPAKVRKDLHEQKKE